MNTLEYIQNNKDRFLNELFELLREPSISADPTYSKNVYKTAEMVRDSLKKIGISNSKLFETKGHPIVYAEKIIDQTLPTMPNILRRFEKMSHIWEHLITLLICNLIYLSRIMKTNRDSLNM